MLGYLAGQDLLFPYFYRGVVQSFLGQDGRLCRVARRCDGLCACALVRYPGVSWRGQHPSGVSGALGGGHADRISNSCHDHDA